MKLLKKIMSSFRSNSDSSDDSSVQEVRKNIHRGKPKRIVCEVEPIPETKTKSLTTSKRKLVRLDALEEKESEEVCLPAKRLVRFANPPSVVLEEEDDEDWEEEEEEEEEFYDLLENEHLVYLEQEHPELYEKFKEVRKYLVAEIPKIDTLLETPMHIRDKARIIELFEMFCVCEPLTFEWIELKNQIKDMTEKAVAKYNTHQTMDEEMKKRVETELEQLKKANTTEEETFEQTIALMKLPLKYKQMIYKRYASLDSMYDNGDETGKIVDWLSVVTKIPFGVYLQMPGEKVVHDLKEVLDMEFYGMQHVKEQILIYVSNKLYNPEAKTYPLGMIGPPGTAKTSIALAISKALQFPFEQLSGGGLIHSDGIHGHSYTYVGAQCGDLVKALMRMECSNGILFIDEFEKLSTEKNLNSILQIIDPVQNHHFKDNFVGDIPIDLSKVWFILSMNEVPENQALRDRIYCVHIQGYTDKEKFKILKHNVVPKLLEKYKLTCEVEDSALHYIIANTEGEGMRQCIHVLTNILCKIVFLERHPDIPVSFSMPLENTRRVDADRIRELLKETSTGGKVFHSMYL